MDRNYNLLPRTLPEVGEIKASDINIELTRSPTQEFSLNDPEVRQLAGKVVPNSEIKFSDFWGMGIGTSTGTVAGVYDITQDKTWKVGPKTYFYNVISLSITGGDSRTNYKTNSYSDNGDSSAILRLEYYDGTTNIISSMEWNSNEAKTFTPPVGVFFEGDGTEDVSLYLNLYSGTAGTTAGDRKSHTWIEEASSSITFSCTYYDRMSGKEVTVDGIL